MHKQQVATGCLPAVYASRPCGNRWQLSYHMTRMLPTRTQAHTSDFRRMDHTPAREVHSSFMTFAYTFSSKGMPPAAAALLTSALRRLGLSCSCAACYLIPESDIEEPHCS